jgi:putative hemolysin
VTNLKVVFRVFLRSFGIPEPYSGGVATAVVVILLTYFSLVIGELVPKRIGMSNPEGIAKALATPMRYVSIITHPFIWLLTKSTQVIVTIFKIKPVENNVTEEEIKAIINEGTETGAIEETGTGNNRKCFSPGRPKHNVVNDSPKRYCMDGCGL